MAPPTPMPTSGVPAATLMIIINARPRPTTMMPSDRARLDAPDPRRILAGGAGLAWSLGFFTIDIDVAALLEAATTQVDGRVINQLQTVAIAALVLTMALVLWWWAEAATD